VDNEPEILIQDGEREVAG